ncbi:MAG: creatininase family protein [Armatimonadota bacterium]|nr:creatininase family protein [Armatimonadota bacterium]
MSDTRQPEVRYHMLRPEQIVARRKEFPAAYIPLGTLEWHGAQNAVGADALQAEGIAIRCARKGGGLIFPPLYYGESRSESIIEVSGQDRHLIAEKMELPPENFGPDRQPFSGTEQIINYHKLLLHILCEVESLGFLVGVFVVGHYPLIDHARAVASQFNQRRLMKFEGMLAWAFVDYLLVEDAYPGAGDHAGGWETSHMMALYPETVNLDLIPPRGEPDIGTIWRIDPRDSTAEFGQKILDKAVDVAVKEVTHRIENFDLYLGHGKGLQEGLWRRESRTE